MNSFAGIKCDSCQFVRGHRAFDKGKTTCKKCIQDEKEREYLEQGIDHYKICKDCKEPKHLFKEYNKQYNGLMQGDCKSCRRLYNMARNGSTGFKVLCKKDFVFNGKRLCSDCDKILDESLFITKVYTCKGCRVTQVLKEHKELKLMSEDDKKAREEKVSRKKVSQNEFIEKFNNGGVTW
jgi:hypothetical protein